MSIVQAKFSSDAEYQLVEPPPSSTSVVDTSIELFARLLPLQDVQTTQKVITQLLESIKSPKLDKNAGRKMAVNVNAVVGIVLALRNAMGAGPTGGHGSRQARETFGSAGITGMLSPFLMVCFHL